MESTTGQSLDWDAIFAAVDARQEAFLARLREIIRVDNTVPPGLNCDTLVDLIAPQFEAAGMTTRSVVIPTDLVNAIPLPLEGVRVNLVATRKAGKPPLTIYVHMDTVPVEEHWDYARRCTMGASTGAASPT